MMKLLEMNRTNTEKLNSLKVGDCLNTVGIGDFKFNSLLSATIGFKYYELYSNGTSIDEFKVAYISTDYVLISWWDYYGYYTLSNLYQDE